MGKLILEAPGIGIGIGRTSGSIFVFALAVLLVVVATVPAAAAVVAVAVRYGLSSLAFSSIVVSISILSIVCSRMGLVGVFPTSMVVL